LLIAEATRINCSAVKLPCARDGVGHYVCPLTTTGAEELVVAHVLEWQVPTKTTPFAGEHARGLTKHGARTNLLGFGRIRLPPLAFTATVSPQPGYKTNPILFRPCPKNNRHRVPEETSVVSVHSPSP